MKSKLLPRSFRPWPENQARLDYAQSLGLDLSEVVNQVLQEHLKRHLEGVREKRAKELRQVLSAPVP